MKILLFLLLVCTSSFTVTAQEENCVYQYGRKYISIYTNRLELLNRRIEKHQQHWLNKLAKKENKWLKKIKQKDSTTYLRISQSSPKFDSIQKLLQPDSLSLSKHTKGKKQPAIDSLKKIEHFLSANTRSIEASNSFPNVDTKLDALQNKLSYQQYINGLIEQRSKDLKNQLKNSSKNLPLPKGLEKEMFYGAAKLKAFKSMADKPSKAEDKALEVLQGTEGFDKALSFDSKNGMQGANSVDDLEKMGFQTKRMLNTQLQQKFGNNLSAVQQQMGSQIKEFQNAIHTDQLDKIKQCEKEAQQNLSSIKQSVAQLRKTEKPSFSVNPMRGLPFRKRIEKSYSWNTFRATPDGSKPAIMDISIQAGYKQTPKLHYGIGISGSFGLGQDWSNIQLTFQGIGFRTYTSWQCQYGVGAYAGYERIFGVVHNSTTNNEINQLQLSSINHNQESIFFGLTKSYKINSKWNGQMQLLYDVWWKEKGLMNPIVFRITTIK